MSNNEQNEQMNNSKQLMSNSEHTGVTQIEGVTSSNPE